MEETNTATMPAKATELELMTKQAEAQFALSPIGQMSRQFELVQKMGDYYAQSTVLPAIYQKNPANCAIAINMAARMGADPLMVMQNLYIVHGNPAWSSKFLIGCINTCGRFQPLEYEGNGKAVKDPGFAIRCVGYAKADAQKKAPLKGTWITWDMVNSEGWSSKPGSKWKTMPEQMFRYRAAAFWQRTYAPEISMGLMTQEEAEDAGRQVMDTGYVEIKENTLRGEAIDPNPFSGADSAETGENNDSEPAAPSAPATPTPTAKTPTPPPTPAAEEPAQPSGRTPDF